MPNLYRLWRSGDDLLLVIDDVGCLELNRDDALALSAQIVSIYASIYTPAAIKKTGRARVTPDERAEMCRLYEGGIGSGEIAKRFDRSRGTVHLILRTAGIPARDQAISERMRIASRKRAA